MKIGIIGVFIVGIVLVICFIDIGYRVLVVNSCGFDSLKDKLVSIDVCLIVVNVFDVSNCDVIFLVFLWVKVKQVFILERDWGGCVLVDVINIFLSYVFDFCVDNLYGDFGSEMVVRFVSFV